MIPKGYASKADYIATLRINLRLLQQPDFLPNASKEWKEEQIARIQAALKANRNPT